MTSTQAASAIDINALAEQLAGQLEDPTYCVKDSVAPDGFARFETKTSPGFGFALGVDVDECTVKATLTLVSDGDNEVAGVAGEVVEIVVRRVAR